MAEGFRPSRREVLLGAASAAAMLAASGPFRGAAAAIDELSDLTAVQAVQALAAGQMSTTEYAEALLARAERYKDLNAFISLDPEGMMASAKAVDARFGPGRETAPLFGLPFAVKDNINSAALPTTGGTPALKDFRPPANAPVLQSVLDANGILMGKLNMHELAFGITSNNQAFGPVHNPYDPSLIPGGSSGGTAAAVAARIFPVGLGTDTGGSTRIPAALCGIVGFRPSLGRWPQTGIVPLSYTRDTAGPMGRTVDDIILMDEVCGHPHVVVPTVRLEGIRIGVPRRYFYEGLDPELEAVVNETLDALSNAGAILVEANMPNIGGLNGAVSFPLVLFEVLREMSAYLYRAGSRMSVIDLVEQVAGDAERQILMSQMGDDAVPAAAYREVMTLHRPNLQRAYNEYFTNNDVAAMIVPTTPLPARPIGQDQTVELNGEQVPTFVTYIRNTDPPSNAGLPCLSLPVGLTASGLPVGMEIVGPFQRDDTLLGIGRAIEALRGVLPPPAMG